MRIIRTICMLSLVAVFSSETCFAHSGGLDSSGGHHDRKNGGYHYHSSSARAYTPPAALPAFLPPAPRRSARTTARMSARVEARQQKEEFAETKPVEKATDPPKFIFHHRAFEPYEVIDFDDNEEYWHSLLTKRFRVNLRKTDIVRIEPVDDPMELRTWIDSTGKFSTVAKFLDLERSKVNLLTIDEQSISVPLRRLSDVDQRHVRKILVSK